MHFCVLQSAVPIFLERVMEWSIVQITRKNTLQATWADQCSAIGLLTLRPDIEFYSFSRPSKSRESPLVSHTSKILMSSNEILIGFSWQLNLERGCPGATLRVWPWRERNKTPVELCGISLPDLRLTRKCCGSWARSQCCSPWRTQSTKWNRR